jgi:hypothetical protein
MKKKQTSGPDFICIGAPRAGTSWLYKNLNSHPDIWLPYIKELHYFDREQKYISPNFLSPSDPLKRILKFSYFKNVFHKLIIGIKNKDTTLIRWYLKFYFGYYNDKWYKSLFKEGNDKIKGELTPSYSILEENDVKKVSELIPNIKIIYILRNPIYRTWSGIRRKNENLSFDDFKKMVNLKGFEDRINYLNNIDLWKKYFPSDNILVLFYDELYENPYNFISKIYNFLQVQNLPIITTSKVFSAPEKDLPFEFKKYLIGKYSNLIVQLNERYNNKYTNKWVNEL